MVPDVIADATAEVLHEVIGAFVVGLTTDGGSRGVEAGAGSADAAHKIKAQFLTKTRLVEHVEVGQDRAVVYFVEDVDTLSSPPGGFDVKAEAVLEKNRVTAEVEVGAALFRWQRRVVGRGGRQERAAANKDVTLLVGGELGDGKLGGEQKRENRCKKR